MSTHLRIVALVCIAVFAFTAVTAMASLVSIDAQTPIGGLFGVLCATDHPHTEDAALPASPSIQILSARAPPIS